MWSRSNRWSHREKFSLYKILSVSRRTHRWWLQDLEESERFCVVNIFTGDSAMWTQDTMTAYSVVRFCLFLWTIKTLLKAQSQSIPDRSFQREPVWGAKGFFWTHGWVSVCPGLRTDTLINERAVLSYWHPSIQSSTLWIVGHVTTVIYCSNRTSSSVRQKLSWNKTTGRRREPRIESWTHEEPVMSSSVPFH